MTMQSTLYHAGKTQSLSSDDWLVTIAAADFDAVIFDCDGTLIDSSDVHTRCLQAATQEQGHQMSADWYGARNGLDRKSLFEAFRDTIGTFDVERACRTSIAHYDQVVHLARPIPDVVNLAKALRACAVPLAVGTNGERPVCELLLATVNILELFDTVVCISDNVSPKPSPAMFHLAAERLGHAAGKVLVIEDSAQGVQAAKTAGMSVIESSAPTREVGR